MSSPENCRILIEIERVDGHWFASATGHDRGFGVCAGQTPAAALQELLNCARNIRMNYPGNPLLRDLAEMAVETIGKDA